MAFVADPTFSPTTFSSVQFSGFDCVLFSFSDHYIQSSVQWVFGLDFIGYYLLSSIIIL